MKKKLFSFLLLGVFLGCSYPQTHEIFDQRLSQRWMVPKTLSGPDASMPPVEWSMVRETSMSLHREHWGPLNGDSRTSGAMTIEPEGKATNSGGGATGFPSAVTAESYLITGITGIVSFLVGHGVK